MAFKVIGLITGTAATRVRLTSTQTGDKIINYPVQEVRVEAVIGNTGAVSVGDSTIVASSQVGVAAVLPKCAATGPTSVFQQQGYGAQNPLNLADFYIDVATSNDKVLVSVIET